ncbi:MAG: hypothetical protein QM757_40510 [Paludibaculum sp.]
MYADTLNVSNDRPYTDGFNQATSTPISNDAGLTFCCGVGAIGGLATGRTPMNDPFPVRPASRNIRCDQPLLRSLLAGLARFNQDTNTLPWDYKPALQHRWRFGFQREIFHNLMVDVSYNGGYATQPIQRRLNYLPADYWTKGMVRDQANDNALNANVANPWAVKNLGALQSSNPDLYRWMSGNAFFTSSVISRNKLLRDGGQYGILRGMNLPGQSLRTGFTKYHDLERWWSAVSRRASRRASCTPTPRRVCATGTPTSMTCCPRNGRTTTFCRTAWRGRVSTRCPSARAAASSRTGRWPI